MFKHITFKTKMLLGISTIVILNSIILSISAKNEFSKLISETAKLQTLQKNALLAEEISFHILVVKDYAFNAAKQKNPNGFKLAEPEIKTIIGSINELLAQHPSDEDSNLLNQLLVDFDAYFNLNKQMLASYGKGDAINGDLLTNQIEQQAVALGNKLKDLKYREKSKAIDIDQVNKQALLRLGLILLLLGVLGVCIALYLNRYLHKQLGIDPYYAKGIAKEIARGELSRSIMVEKGDTSSLLFALEKMRQQLLAMRLADQKTITEMLRVKFALDIVSVGMMITDSKHAIVYANAELTAIFAKAEHLICQITADFSASHLIGKQIQQLSFIPASTELLNSLTETHKIPLTLGDHHMVIVITPVINAQGERIGSVSEWHDHTEEVQVENELAAVVAAASMGDFNRVFNVQGKEGVMRLLGEGINQLMHTNKVSLDEISRVLGAITRGDLTENITNAYFGAFGELKDSTNGTVDTLKEIISKIRDVTTGIRSGSQEIASGNNDLSNRTEKQAVSLQHTTSNLSKLTTAVQNNAENAKNANQLAILATQVATKGGEVIDDVINTMKGINTSSRKVVDIISVIDGIAFQTNILALNAAVEAARAGDQGRGFAVVAGEVRNLAKLAAVAAGEIKSLIGDSVEKVDEGSNLVTEAGKTMDEILHSIRIVTGIMGNITEASEEQSVGIELVNRAIAELDMVTQQNAALVEQSAAAAESLEEQAQNLTVMVENFKLL